MTIKQKIQRIIAPILFIGAFLIAVPLVSVSTAEPALAGCGGAQTSIINCDEGDGSDGDVQNTGLWYILLLIINILTAGVGVLALAGIVYGAVLYTSAGGNAEQVKKAMGIFTNVVIGVVAFAGMYALLNFLIPGGAFNSL